jgi:putative membrane protein
VAEAEKGTSCEYIVVLAPASDRYEGRALKAGALAALVVFAAVYLVNLYGFDTGSAPGGLLLEGVGAGALVTLLATRVAPLRRLLIPRWRMHDAVQNAANAVFTEENVSLTKDRNAVLLYVSVLEGEALLMPDIGVTRKVPEAKLGEIHSKLTHATGNANQLVCDAIKALGECCKECYPRADDDQNELMDRPQIRLP